MGKAGHWRFNFVGLLFCKIYFEQKRADTWVRPRNLFLFGGISVSKTPYIAPSWRRSQRLRSRPEL
jgi:hypothetical protein